MCPIVQLLNLPPNIGCLRHNVERAKLLQAHVASVNETRQWTWDEQRREDDQDKSREETAMQCGKCNASKSLD